MILDSDHSRPKVICPVPLAVSPTEQVIAKLEPRKWFILKKKKKQEHKLLMRSLNMV